MEETRGGTSRAYGGRAGISAAWTNSHNIGLKQGEMFLANLKANLNEPVLFFEVRRISNLKV